MAVNRANFWRI